MDFELTEDQKNAMAMIEAFMAYPPPIPAKLTGFAGTGKTTLIKAVASLYGEPLVLTPTGKVALRVVEATGLEAITIHRWLYQPMENQKTGEVEFRLKDTNSVEFPHNRLIVIDEYSMVGRELWTHIWGMVQELGLRVLLVGDPFQLRSIEFNRGQEDFTPFDGFVDVETPFSAHLGQVTRQALDSPILRASMMLRESNRIDQALSLLKRVFTKSFDDKCLEVYQAGGAVIVHKNDTRHRLNAMIRNRLGYGEDVRDGEPLLVLRNTYEIDRFNGEVIPFQGWTQYDSRPKAVRDNWKNVSLMLTFGLAKVDGQEVMLSPEQVRGDAALMTDSVIGRNSKWYYGDNYHPRGEPLYDEQKRYLGPPHLHCNFGYALTCHKSQGSEWNQVLVLIEGSTRPTTYEGRRWLYTAITRARESVYFAMEA